MTKTVDQMVAIIAAALDERRQPAAPEPNPYADYTEEARIAEAALVSHGVQKFADNIPAVNKAGAGSAGFEMEAARIEGLKAGSQHRQAVRRHRSQRVRQRQAVFERLVDRPKKVSPERMAQAWVVMVPLLGIVDRIATEKQQWAERFLGAITDELPNLVVEKMALVLAKGKWDLDLMAEAAAELGEHARISRRIPGDQLTDDERVQRRLVRRCRKDLMSMVNTCATSLLKQLYRDTHNLRWENLDVIDTVIASVSGVGADPYVSRTKADRAPAMLGATFAGPGEIDRNAIAAAISAAITDRGLDRLTELLLNENNRRADGSVKWRELAEQIFRATPGGGLLWDDVERVTARLEVPARARAAAARRHVRQVFDWLPGFVVSVVDSFDIRPVAFSHGRKLLASEIETYRPGVDPLGEKRYPLRPALTFATAEEAARVLVENISHLITGEDLVDSIYHA